MTKKAGYGMTRGILALAGVGFVAALTVAFWPTAEIDVAPGESEVKVGPVQPGLKVAPAAGPELSEEERARLRAEGVTPPSPKKQPEGVEPNELVEADVVGTGTALLAAEPLRDWTGDFDGLQERKLVRFLVTYNRTNFFVQDGQERGFEYELIQQFEDFLNADLAKGEQPFAVVMLPVPFEQLIPRLQAGEGDVIAAGLTITPERSELIEFSDPYLPQVNEIVVAAESTDALERLEDLAGRTVHVSAGRTYAGNLRALSERLEADGMAPIEVIEVDPRLETEDVLQLVNAGLVELTVADDHIAQIWADKLHKIVLRDDLAVHEGGGIGWALRHDSPKLKAKLDAFMAQHERGTLLGNILFDRYFKDDSWISNPLAPEQQLELARYADYFMEYGRSYDFDWRLIAALAFQESRLNPRTKSNAGAVGLMQIKPSTAAEPAIALPDVNDIETNVHAGVKYLDYLRRRYFDQSEIAPAAQVDFTLAAYNAGPRRVAEMRNRAEERDLDPNVWFRNVELVAFDEFSRETVDYVANINKYYVAYRMSDERLRSRGEAIDEMASQ